MMCGVGTCLLLNQIKEQQSDTVGELLGEDVASDSISYVVCTSSVRTCTL